MHLSLNCTPTLKLQSQIAQLVTFRMSYKLDLRKQVANFFGPLETSEIFNVFKDQPISKTRSILTLLQVSRTDFEMCDKLKRSENGSATAICMNHHKYDAVTMSDVKAAISEKVRQMVANNILFKFLNDESLSATERLRRIAPPFSYFVLAFHDLQAHVLKYPDEETETDHIKAAINAHCADDSTHWPMFVTDLKTLRVDKETSYTSAIKHLWGKRTRTQRHLCYDLATLAHEANDPILRFAYVLSFEINGSALFGKFLELAERSETETGKELLYFGRCHFLRETGGLHGQEDAENELLEMELSSKMRAKALEIAMKQLEIQDAQWSDLAMAAFANEKW